MREAVLRFLLSHATTAAFAWGAFKALCPLPSPSYFLLAGAGLSQSGAGAACLRIFWRIALPGAVGGVLGAYPYYYLADRGGWPLVDRLAPWIGLDRARLKGWEKKWRGRRTRHSRALMASSLGSVLLGALLAGLSDCGFWEYAGWALFGGVVRGMILGAAGWRLGFYGDPVVLLSPGMLALGGALTAAVLLGVIFVRLRNAWVSKK